MKLFLYVFIVSISFISCKRDFTDTEYEKAYEIKMNIVESILGKSDSVVGHAFFPFELGGAVDMYYFRNAIPGTGFATMELIEPDGSGPKPNTLGTYELVAFTKHLPDTISGSPYNKIESRICGIFTTAGFYSKKEKIDPGETAEMPGDSGETNKCLLFHEWKKDGVNTNFNGKKFGLLLCIEIHRSEMEYAMKNGSQNLISELKRKGFYPYSDLDREPVF